MLRAPDHPVPLGTGGRLVSAPTTIARWTVRPERAARWLKLDLAAGERQLDGCEVEEYAIEHAHRAQVRILDAQIARLHRWAVDADQHAEDDEEPDAAAAAYREVAEALADVLRDIGAVIR